MKRTSLTLIFIAAILFSGLIIRAQVINDSAGAPIPVDSAVKASDSTQIHNATTTTIDGIPIPQPLQTAAVALLTLLPAIQLTLKRIPTPYSVKICGWLGKILDALTWFQKDLADTKGTIHPANSCATK
jgi:hypothetical protein